MADRKTLALGNQILKVKACGKPKVKTADNGIGHYITVRPGGPSTNSPNHPL